MERSSEAFTAILIVLGKFSIGQSFLNLAKQMEDVPEGYCGFCEICGKPGHMRAHPSLPISGAWCDEHWDDLNQGRTITLGVIVQYVFYATITGVFLYSAYSAWKTFSG